MDIGPSVAGKTWLNCGFQEGSLLRIAEQGKLSSGSFVWGCSGHHEGTMEMTLAEHWFTELSGWFQVVQGWCPANPGQQVPDVE